MVEQSNTHTVAGAHPTNQQFVAQLERWGFALRKKDGPHLVFRGPNGGTLRVVRAMTGRAEADRMAKAAELAGISLERFWAGPAGVVPETRLATQQRPAERVMSEAAPPRRRPRPDQDQVTSLVLDVHTAADRPLGFDRVVKLANGSVTRDQVRTASAQLCRDGDLERIRPGVYQWSGGKRARIQAAPAPTPPVSLEAPRQLPLAAPTSAKPRGAAAELFEQLFPTGVRMTAELLADYEQWAELTEKLAQHAHAA